VEYNTALVIFFVPCECKFFQVFILYGSPLIELRKDVLFEIPSNIILKRLKPHVWLSFCMFMFGLVSICQGLVSNYGGLLTTRFFLGVFETGMFPGCFYLIGMWYRRPEAQKRYTFFFNSTSLAGAFGGLLASAIGKMDGMRGYQGWRWIFILEGVLTCVVSFIFFFCLPDFPEEAKWLTEPERAYVKARLQADQGKSARDRRITPKDVLNVFKDFKIFLGGLMYFGLM
jgi:MFS family permease